MTSLLFASYLLIHCILLVMTFRFAQQPSPRIWFVRALLIGMIYDNSILVIAPHFVDATWFEAANYPRFIMHALFLPFLVLYGWSAMRDAGVRMARGRVGFVACWIWVAIAVAWGFWHDVLNLNLAATEAAGHVRLTNQASLPPIATILSNIFVLPMAAAVWRCAGWKWFFLGALFIFIVNGATAAKPWGFMAGNGAEVLFVLSLLRTERFFAARVRD